MWESTQFFKILVVLDFVHTVLGWPVSYWFNKWILILRSFSFCSCDLVYIPPESSSPCFEYVVWNTMNIAFFALKHLGIWNLNYILDRHQVWRSHDPMSIQNFDFCEKKVIIPPHCQVTLVDFYYISWRLENIVKSSKYCYIQNSVIT